MTSSRLGASVTLAAVAAVALLSLLSAEADEQPKSNERSIAYVHWETRSRAEAPVPISELQLA
jgi:hypothetical protein